MQRARRTVSRPARPWVLLRPDLLLGLSLRQLLALLLEHRPAAELDLVAFERQHLYQDLVALLEFIAHFADAVLGDLADVQQTVGPRENLDEGAEIHQPDHRA